MNLSVELERAQRELKLAQARLDWLRDQQPLMFDRTHAQAKVAQESRVKRVKARVEALQEQYDSWKRLNSGEFFEVVSDEDFLKMAASCTEKERGG